MKERVFQLLLFLSVLAVCLYSYFSAQNRFTAVQMQVPKIALEIQKLREENQRLTYQLEKFQGPAHLMELAQRPEYSHLKHPALREVLQVPEIYAQNSP